MAEKETKSCSDCIHYDVCYKIEHYGRDLETTSACKQFIGKNDVAPVKHGHWDDISESCSVCGKHWAEGMVMNADDYGYFDPMPAYCPNCGAKMDGGEGE